MEIHENHWTPGKLRHDDEATRKTAPLTPLNVLRATERSVGMFGRIDGPERLRGAAS
jgi:hypothetical protein